MIAVFSEHDSFTGTVRRGIVIRSFLPERNKCLLFEKDEGLNTFYLPAKASTLRLAHGAILTGESPQNRPQQLQQIQLIAMPALWARADIYFLHQILDLAARFLHPGLPAFETWSVLRKLYGPLPRVGVDESYKACLLAEFLLSLGILPEEDEEDAQIDPHILISQLQAAMVNEQDVRASVAQLMRWIDRCLALHGVERSVLNSAKRVEWLR